MSVVSSHCSMMRTGNNVYQSTTTVECKFLIMLSLVVVWVKVFSEQRFQHLKPHPAQLHDQETVSVGSD